MGVQENVGRGQRQARQAHQPGRPVHLRWRYLGVVFAGGTLGTALRELLVLAVPATGGFPLAIFGVNVAGAFLLGALLEALTRRGADVGRRRVLRLLFGTGVLGGFTTYSALATDTALFLARDEPSLALVYAFATVLLGGLASWLGIIVAAAIHRRTTAGATDAAATGGEE